MRIEGSRTVEHLGSVKIHGVRRVLELDSGMSTTARKAGGSGEIQVIEHGAIEAVESRMAIVLPVMNEDLKVFEGVLCGVPHDCLIIVVSNSQRAEIDYFKSEQDILNRFCQATERRAIIVHQKDPFVAHALDHAGYTELLDENGFIRSGKSEGMILGILLAKLLGKEYVGFIDTDNFIPGAVWEYAKHFALGFSLADSPHAMVRILWHYKPKVQGELYFKKWGRVSEITNRHINHLLSTKGRFETEIIKTANAGEHAMTLELALRLTYASGYGVETQELVSLIERFGGILPAMDKAVAEKGIDVIQTETVNPHIHEERGGNEHLYRDMLLPSLSVIYHSPLCETSTQRLIMNQLTELGCIQPEEEVPRVCLIPPPERVDFQIMSEDMERQMAELAVPHGWTSENIATPRRSPTEARKIIYTDLDGTLLHPLSFSYAPALESLRLLQNKNIPVVFCSAKTRSEQEALRRELGIRDPFIVENGGAIFIPEDYFRFPFNYDRKSQEYFVIDLGAPYAEIRQRLKLVAEETGNLFHTFGDASVEEVSRYTGLNLMMAQLAREREYSETIIIPGGQRDIEKVRRSMGKQGLHFSFGGRFYEASLGSDKGKAVRVLNELFKLNYGRIFTFGLGDTENDVPMLEATDSPLLVQDVRHHWNSVRVKNLTRVKGTGPEGWRRAVNELVLKQSLFTQ